MSVMVGGVVIDSDTIKLIGLPVPALSRGKPALTGIVLTLKAAEYLLEITQPFGLSCRTDNKARERAAYPVGTASVAKQAPR